MYSSAGDLMACNFARIACASAIRRVPVSASPPPNIAPNALFLSSELPIAPPSAPSDMPQEGLPLAPRDVERAVWVPIDDGILTETQPVAGPSTLPPAHTQHGLAAKRKRKEQDKEAFCLSL